MEDKKKENQTKHSMGIKASFSTRKFKQGAYATVVSAIVIVIVLVINLFAAKIDLKKDLTLEGKYSLTPETIDLIKGVKDTIKIYYISQTGQELDEFEKIIDNYDKINSNVTVEYKDPVLYPKFASEYVDNSISAQSFLVVNETNNQAKYIDYSEVLEYSMNPNTQQPQITGLNIESKIDSAVQAVTNKHLPKIYEVSGHGETAITTMMGTLLSNGNVTHKELNTLTSEEIPKDCDILLINQPQSDYTKDEVTMILDYLKAGNKAIICTDYVTPTLPEFNEILKYYGVNVVPGVVVETDSNYFRGRYPTELVPQVCRDDFTDGFYGKKYVVSMVSSGFTMSDQLRDTEKATDILKTSDTSYSKTDVNSKSIKKTKADIDGPFLLGVDIKESVGDKETRLAVYSGKYMWEDSYLSATSYANVDLLYNTINKMTGQKNVITVRSISLQEPVLALTSAQKNRNGLMMMAVLPMIFIIPGIAVVVRRRKK